MHSDQEDVTELRRQAEELSIPDAAAMSAEQLRDAIAQRRRGADPKQATTARGDEQG